MGWFFLFFFVSGFCSILYEIVWLRLSMAQFGVTTALVSIVLSMFMAGLGLGSWGAGYAIRRYGDRISIPALSLYAFVELLIGISALAVPAELSWGRPLLLRTRFNFRLLHLLSLLRRLGCPDVDSVVRLHGGDDSAGHAVHQQKLSAGSPRSFSFLYLANVLGAVGGRDSAVAADRNLRIPRYAQNRSAAEWSAVCIGRGLVLAVVCRAIRRAQDLPWLVRPTPPVRLPSGNKPLILLFLTGLTSMGAEVVWIRQFTPYLSTVVYAFASILGVYLAATFAGIASVSLSGAAPMITKEDWSGERSDSFRLLPVLTASPFFQVPNFHSALLRLVLGIGPFSAILGFVTPMLVDRWSGGDPDQAGEAYAVNVVGCILGPLVAGFILLPLMSERWVLFVFALPLVDDRPCAAMVSRSRKGQRRRLCSANCPTGSRYWRWLRVIATRKASTTCSPDPECFATTPQP